MAAQFSFSADSCSLPNLVDYALNNSKQLILHEIFLSNFADQAKRINFHKLFFFKCLSLKQEHMWDNNNNVSQLFAIWRSCSCMIIIIIIVVIIIIIIIIISVRFCFIPVR